MKGAGFAPRCSGDEPSLCRLAACLPLLPAPCLQRLWSVVGPLVPGRGAGGARSSCSRRGPWVGTRPGCSAAGRPLGRAEPVQGEAWACGSRSLCRSALGSGHRFSFRRVVGVTARVVKRQNKATQACAPGNPLPPRPGVEAGHLAVGAPAPAWRGAWLPPAECSRPGLRSWDAPSGPPGCRVKRGACSGRHAGSGMLGTQGLGPCSGRAVGRQPTCRCCAPLTAVRRRSARASALGGAAQRRSAKGDVPSWWELRGGARFLQELLARNTDLEGVDFSRKQQNASLRTQLSFETGKRPGQMCLNSQNLL